MNDIQITIDTPIFHNIDDIQSTLNEVPVGIMIPGIHIYYAVFTGNVKNYTEFKQWYSANPLIDSLSWMP
jgi:hypothetical protein